MTLVIRKKHPIHLFTAFIDLTKAFDSVNHQLLWGKLAAMGLSTKMLRVTEDLYANAASVVMMDGYISDQFR